MNKEALNLFGKSFLYSILLSIIFIASSIILLFPFAFNLIVLVIPFCFVIFFVALPFFINKFAHSILFGWRSKLLSYTGTHLDMIKAHFSFNASLLLFLSLTIMSFIIALISPKSISNSSPIDSSIAATGGNQNSSILLSFYDTLKALFSTEIATFIVTLYAIFGIISFLLIFKAAFKPLLEIKFLEKHQYRFDLYFLYIINNKKHSFKDISIKYNNCKWTNNKDYYCVSAISFCMLLFTCGMLLIKDPVINILVSLTSTTCMNLFSFIITWKEYEEVENYKPMRKEKKKAFSFNFGLNKN